MNRNRDTYTNNFMKRVVFVLVVAFFVSVLAVGCTGKSAPRQQGRAADSLNVAASGSVSVRAGATVPGIRLPAVRLLGPLNPIPGMDEQGNELRHFVLLVANLGHYESLADLKASPFYLLLCNLYPELGSIRSVSVDLGRGDLWLIRPWAENTSLAINEYNLKMFMGEQEEGSGEIYLRTEDTECLLARFSADDPGSVLINAVDNEGASLRWIPTQNPHDNELRTEPGVEVYTYDPMEAFVQYGADYTGTLKGRPAVFRFYADRQLRLNGELVRYFAFHDNSGGISLYIKGEHIEECLSVDNETFQLQPE